MKEGDEGEEGEWNEKERKFIYYALWHVPLQS